MADPVFNYIAANPFGLNDVGFSANPTFVDIDGDGDLDAFVGNSGGNTLFFRNTGTISSPLFASAVTNPFGLSAGGGRLSAFADIDSDGDLDAFMGNWGGNTLFFRNTGTGSIPLFGAPQTNPFGLNDVGNGANSAFVDIDGDGDLDAFVGNYGGNTLFFRNTGTASNPTFVAPEINPFGLSFVRGSAKSAFVDIDSDGDLDAFVGSGHYTGSDMWFFRNIGTASNPVFYRDSVNPFGLRSVGSYLTPVFADIDDDNDFDAFVGNGSGDTTYYQNMGIGTVPHFSGVGSFGIEGVGYVPNPTFVDIDGDGDLDAFVGKGRDYYGGVGDTLFFENTGTVINPIFAAAITNPFGLSNVGSFASPTFVDIDSDNDLDAFVGNDAGNTLFFENTGTIINPIFAAAITNPFGLSDVGINARPTFVDIDADNDQDIFINNIFYENTGSESSPVFGAAQTNPLGLSGSYKLAFIDVDGDGDSDAFSGLQTGLFRAC